VLHDETAAHLARFVREGGHLVLTVRTGAKDWENALRPALPPGPLAPLAGVVVEDAYPLTGAVRVAGRGMNGAARIWAERLRVEAPDVEVLARFGRGNGWLAGRPAVTRRRAGRGRVTVLAGWFEPALLDRVLAEALAQAGVRPRFSGSPGVEVAVRSGQGREVAIAMNHADRPGRVAGVTGVNLLSGRAVRGRLTLPPREVAVVRLARGGRP
jgi:beta-galactosidase